MADSVVANGLGPAPFPAPEVAPPGELTEVATAIRQAYDLGQPLPSLRKIAALWEALDKAAELAEARTRLLLGALEGPPLAEAPAWLETEFTALRAPDEHTEPEEQPVRAAAEVAAKLVRACLAATDGGEQAQFSAGINGRVVVDWDLKPHRLQWMVEAAELPWPGVKVYLLTRRGTGSDATRMTRVIRNAFDLIDHFREFSSR